MDHDRGAPSRLVSLDVFRGATIAAMILVNNPGDWGNVYWPLLHAPWHGWTPTDLIFPFFLFMVGVSLTFSRRLEARPALVRAAKLIGLGLLLAAYPYFDLLNLRWPGVLQRIALCYLAAWAARRWLSTRAQAALAAVLLAGYWLAMTRIPGPGGAPPSLEPDVNLAARVDRVFLTGHMWGQTKTWDPEGLLSTLPAIATALLGLLCGAWLRARRSPARTTIGLLAVGLALLAAGVYWGDYAPAWLLFPFNKALWSPSFVLLTGGLAFAGFGLTYAMCDALGHRRWARPFETYGKNAIAVYVASGLLADTLYVIRWTGADGERVSLWGWLGDTLFGSWLPPQAASLGMALATVLLFYLMALWMDRRGIYLKV
jgi:predicted acyltransferase